MTLILLTFVLALKCLYWPGEGRYVRPAVPVKDIVTSPLPIDIVGEVPSNWDWRSVNGTCFTTPILNQQVPKFCGSCWAHATVSSLSDRLKIQAAASTTDTVLSVQDLLDCGPLAGVGSCDGGSFQKAHEYIHKKGISDWTCKPYLAIDYAFRGEGSCDGLPKCRVCDRFDTCANKNASKVWTVTQYGSFTKGDVASMRAEIYLRGPIPTSIYAHNPLFDAYKGGVIRGKDFCAAPYLTHVVSIVGFGVDTAAGGEPYWIVRNSYGTEWGEDGYFRVVSGVNCLGIESEMGWAVPAAVSV